MALAGGIGPVLARARALADGGDLRMACHLVEHAVLAEPDSAEVHALRAEVYARAGRGAGVARWPATSSATPPISIRGGAGSTWPATTSVVRAHRPIRLRPIGSPDS